jgi:hypothetical protein
MDLTVYEERNMKYIFYPVTGSFIELFNLIGGFLRVHFLVKSKIFCSQSSKSMAPLGKQLRST